MELQTLEPRMMMAGQPIITEFMASNEDTLLDGDGATSDWIEIYNAGDAPIDLAGHHLTDEAAILTKWTFPSLVLAPGQYAVIFASGEHFDGLGMIVDPYIDGGGNLHTNFGLSVDGDYLALTAPDGSTILSEFEPGGTDFGNQREDVSYGIGQTVITDLLVAEGSDITALVPTTGNGGDLLGPSWTGAAGDEPFDDSAGQGWLSGLMGTGYGNFTPPLAVAGELFVSLDAGDATAGGATWSNEGTLGDFVRIGGPQVTTIEGAPALVFNGTATLDSYQSPVSAPAGLVGANPTRTIEVWAYNPGLADEETILAWGKRGGPAGTNMSFNYGTNAAFGAIGHWDAPDIGWGSVPIGGRWNHLVYTFDGSTTRVYSNGELTNSEELGFGVINTHAGTKITLAAQLETDGVTLNTPLRGTLALGRVRIHDGVLSDAQVLNNYLLERAEFPLPQPPAPEEIPEPPVNRYSFNDGTANDSIGSRNGTLVNGAAVSGGRVTMNGVNQYVDLNGNDVAALGTGGALTLEAWGSYDPGTGIWSRIFDLGDTNPETQLGRNYVLLTPHGGGGLTRAVISDTDPGFNHENITEGALVTSGTEIHTVVVFDDAANQMSLYIDGVLASQSSMDISLSAVSAAKGYLGRSLYPDPYLLGSINEFRVYDYGLTGNQILGNFQAGPDTVNLSGDLTGGPEGAAATEAPAIGLDLQSAMQGVNSSAFVRAQFNVADPMVYNSLEMRARYDDGFVAYLNGVEVARRNAPASPAWDSAATASRTISEAIEPEVISLSDQIGLLRTGSNILAIHGLNASAADDDFLIDFDLEARTILQNDKRYFTVPTPGAPNNEGVLNFVKDTQFSVDRGFYDAAFDVVITSSTPGATIIYTTDGSAPTPSNGTQVPAADSMSPGEALVTITATTVLRAAAFKEDFGPSDVDTQSYIFLDDVVAQSHATALARGFPATWGPNVVDYGVDPDVVNNPAYSATFKDDLLTIPSLSLVMDNDDFFGSTNGIYSNATQRGEAWERPGSIELLDPNDLSEFQADSGVRAFGGVGRSTGTPKHGLRLLFKEEHGESKLEFPLFPSTEVETFNGLILRAGWNYTWTGDSGGQTQRADYLRDSFARATAGDMGILTPASRPIHLYVNGLYWGLYTMTERPDETYAEEHLGVPGGEFDILKTPSEQFTNVQLEVVSGDRTAWDQLMSLAATDLSVPANYQAISDLVDLDALIDYMLMIFYTGSRDSPTLLGNDVEPRNFWTLRSREPEGKFHFIPWDVEWSLEDPNINRVNIAGRENPSYIFQRLKNNVDFRGLVADHIHEQFFNGGPLTQTAVTDRYLGLKDEIDRAIVGESARWGDTLRATPYTRDVEWIAEINRLVTTYFSVRTTVVLNQLIAAGWYPAVSAPEFNINGQPQHGGLVPLGSSLSITDPNNPDGTTYYTLDGSDPRSPATGSITTFTLVDENTPARVLVPKVANGGSLLGTTWTGGAAFNDAAWTNSPGGSGIGFDTNPSPQDFTPLIDLNVRTAMTTSPANASVFIRIPFTIASQSVIDSLDALTLRMKYDDGFAAYINGQLVAFTNAPGLGGNAGTLAWNSAATTIHDDNLAVVFQDYAVAQAPGSVLQVGTNILAIHGLNQSTVSSDLLLLPQLIGQDLPSDLSPSAIPYTGAFALDQSAQIKSRVKKGGVWSALSHAIFTVQLPLAVTEINYHPAPPTQTEAMAGFIDENGFEFIELMNRSDTHTINLVGAAFDRGVTLSFGNVTLAPGQRGVVVRNAAAFTARYGNGPMILGQYSGSLANEGERLRLIDDTGQTLADFEYDDTGAWPERADGDGATLMLADPAALPASEPLRGLHYNDGDNWRSSNEYRGSPGAAGQVPVIDVIVNEVLSHTAGLSLDFIELFNTTASPVDLSGWWLSDSSNPLVKHQIADGTILDPLSYLILDEEDFNPTPLTPAAHHFSLDGAHGDDVWLMRGAIGNPLPISFADHVGFGAAFEGQALGRVPDGSAAGDLYPLKQPTPGSANASPVIGPLVVSQVMYQHASNDPNLEYVQIYNSGRDPIDLTDHRLDGEVLYLFAPGQMIGGRTSLTILPFDPADPLNEPLVDAFEAAYGVVIDGRYVGPFDGALDNSGGRVELQAPDAPPLDEPGFTPQVLIDRAVYRPGAPWDALAAGGGASLHRDTPMTFGDSSVSWLGLTPSPASPRGDTDGDGTIDAADIDALFDALGPAVADPRHDLDRDGDADADDVDHLVLNILNILYGDVNTDGGVSIGDLTVLAENFGGPGGWSQGDFTGDGSISIGDLTRLAENFGMMSSSDLLADGDGPASAGLQAIGDGSDSEAAEGPDWSHIAGLLEEDEESTGEGDGLPMVDLLAL